MEVLHLTQQNFEEEVLKSEIPVLVDFWAPWCGPCKMLAPVIEEIATEVDGFKVAKVNVDDEVGLARKYGIQSIPTLIVLENGEEKSRSLGVVSKEQILELLK